MQKFLSILILSLLVVSITAQTPTPPPAPSGIKANLAAGEVSSINQTGNKISLQTSDGLIEVVIVATSAFKRVPPENPVITAAVASSISEIGEKDKILVTGAVSANKKTITAKNIYLMSKSDISKKLAAEKEAWRTRGISGRVVKVDFKLKNITIATRSLMSETEVVITPKESAEFLRYAPESAKFSEAIAGSLAEIKVDDQLRALGDKSQDGLSFKAEKFLTGSFKTAVGKITAIDTAKGEITVEDISNKKPAVIILNKDSLVKRFPDEMAQGLARMMSMSAMGGFQPPQGGQGSGRPQGGQPNTGASGQPSTNTGGSPNGGTSPTGGQRPTRMGGGMGNGNLEDVLERLPALTIADLKIGETIGVSKSSGTANRFTAFKIIAGVEPFLSVPTRTGGAGNQPTINIPGLDGGFGN